MGSATPITVPTSAPSADNTTLPESGNILPGLDFASAPTPAAVIYAGQSLNDSGIHTSRKSSPEAMLK